MRLNDNSKTFLRQMDPEEVLKDFWSKVKSEKVEATLWKKGQTEPYSFTPDYKLSESSQFTTLYGEVDTTYQGIFKESYRGIQIFLKFKFNAELQFFTSGTIDWNDEKKRVTITLGQPFFVTTKRSSCRYVSGSRDRISLTVVGNTFECFDISSGGFSTQLKKDKAGGLDKGLVFEAAELKYNGKKFIIPKVKLVNVIEMKDEPDFVKLAFKFEGLKSSEEDAIWVEVNRSVKQLADLLHK